MLRCGRLEAATLLTCLACSRAAGATPRAATLATYKTVLQHAGKLGRYCKGGKRKAHTHQGDGGQLDAAQDVADGGQLVGQVLCW